MTPRLEITELKALAADCGLAGCAAANLEDVVGCLDRAAWFPRPRMGTGVLLPELTSVPGAASSCAFLACAFAYAGTFSLEDVPLAPTQAAVAAFARANHYLAAVKKAKRLVRRLVECTGLAKKDIRIFVNSRIPEKLIACAAGLGHYGRNRLLFHEKFGSRFILGLIYLPFPLAGKGDERVPVSPDDFCGECHACVSACPVAALDSTEDASLARCMKTRSDTLDPWDESFCRAWGRRLYGCDTCQEVCPKNAHLPEADPVAEGVIGPGVEIDDLLGLSEDEYRSRFRKTALDRTWLPPAAIFRNALCAAGNSGRPELLPAVRRHLRHPQPAVADMAAWAERQLAG